MTPITLSQWKNSSLIHQRITLAEDILEGPEDGYITRHYFVFPCHSNDDYDIKSVVMKNSRTPVSKKKIKRNLTQPL
ncbi:MAG: hypothetical protein R2758_11895 [Bacteroidales bacterium]